MKIFIFGIDGNMGRRYKSILEHLGHDAVGFDITHKNAKFDAASVHGCKGIIIATPTDTHYSYIQTCRKFKLPILCEKPISRDFSEVMTACEMSNLTMVNQYKYLDSPGAFGVTYYDYYNHGRDGLFYDCINIVGNARDRALLLDNSPMWHCILNGRVLSISEMDYAYISMIQDWLNNLEAGNSDYILKSHIKVCELVNATKD